MIEIILDRNINQVKKTYRQFEYFNKMVTDKLGFKDISLNKSIRSGNRYKSLQNYIKELNNGLLLYEQKEQGGQQSGDNIRRKDVEFELTKRNILVRQLRTILYTLLFQEDALFVDGVDDSSDQDKSVKANKKNQFIEHLRRKFSDDHPQTQKLSDPNKYRQNALCNISQKMEKKQTRTNSSKEKGFTLFSKLKTSLKHEDKQKDLEEVSTKNFLVFNLLKSKRKNSFELSQNASIKNILKTITNCWIKCQNNFKYRNRDRIFKPYRWVQYQFKAHDYSIEFSNNEHRRLIVLHSFQVQLSFVNYTKLTIKNSIDKNPLEIRIDIEDDESQQVYEKYLALYTFFKQLSVKVSGLEVLNKLRLRLALKKNTKQSQNIGANTPTMSLNIDKKNSVVKQINVRISHGDIQSGIQKSVSTALTLGFEQFIDIDIPIIDNFGTLEMYFNEVKMEAGFLPNIGIMDSHSSLKIPVQSLYDYVYNQKKPKKKQSQVKNKLIELKNTKASLSIDYKCIGGYQSYCTFVKDDIFEGEEQAPQFSRDQFRMHMNRLKRIIWSIERYSDWIKDIRTFTYPNISYVFYTLFMLFVYLYDNNNMHILLISVLLLILLYNSPAYSIYAPQALQLISCKQKFEEFSKWLYIKNPIISEQYTKTNNKIIRQAFLNQFELTRKNKRNFYKKYKRFTQILLRCQNLALLIVSIFEKVKNIFTWYHYEKTKFVFIGLLCFFGLFIAIPFRYIMIFVIFKLAQKGLKYHTKTQQINKIVLNELIRIVIDQGQLNFMRKFFRQSNRAFDFSNPQTKQFFRKCKQTVSLWLGVTYEQQAILLHAQNMSEFIKKVAKCKTPFLIKQEVCIKYKFSLEWSKNEKSAARLMKLIYGFVITIPSDKMIMGVKTVQDDEQDEMEEGTGHMGELLQF